MADLPRYSQVARVALQDIGVQRLRGLEEASSFGLMSARMGQEMSRDLMREWQGELARQGKKDGSIVVRDEAGNLAPMSVREDRTSYGQAFMAAHAEAFTAALKTDASKQFGLMHQRAFSPVDPDGKPLPTPEDPVALFDRSAEAYTAKSLESVPDYLRGPSENAMAELNARHRMKLVEDVRRRNVAQQVSVLADAVNTSTAEASAAARSGDESLAARKRNDVQNHFNAMGVLDPDNWTPGRISGELRMVDANLDATRIEVAVFKKFSSSYSYRFSDRALSASLEELAKLRPGLVEKYGDKVADVMIRDVGERIRLKGETARSADAAFERGQEDTFNRMRTDFLRLISTAPEGSLPGMAKDYVERINQVLGPRYGSKAVLDTLNERIVSSQPDNVSRRETEQKMVSLAARLSSDPSVKKDEAQKALLETFAPEGLSSIAMAQVRDLFNRGMIADNQRANQEREESRKAELASAKTANEERYLRMLASHEEESARSDDGSVATLRDKFIERVQNALGPQYAAKASRETLNERVARNMPDNVDRATKAQYYVNLASEIASTKDVDKVESENAILETVEKLGLGPQVAARVRDVFARGRVSDINQGEAEAQAARTREMSEARAVFNKKQKDELEAQERRRLVAQIGYARGMKEAGGDFDKWAFEDSKMSLQSANDAQIMMTIASKGGGLSPRLKAAVELLSSAPTSSVVRNMEGLVGVLQLNKEYVRFATQGQSEASIHRLESVLNAHAEYQRRMRVADETKNQAEATAATNQFETALNRIESSVNRAPIQVEEMQRHHGDKFQAKLDAATDEIINDTGGGLSLGRVYRFKGGKYFAGSALFGDGSTAMRSFASFGGSEMDSLPVGRFLNQLPGAFLGSLAETSAAIAGGDPQKWSLYVSSLPGLSTFSAWRPIVWDDYTRNEIKRSIKLTAAANGGHDAAISLATREVSRRLEQENWGPTLYHHQGASLMANNDRSVAVMVREPFEGTQGGSVAARAFLARLYDHVTQTMKGPKGDSIEIPGVSSGFEAANRPDIWEIHYVGHKRPSDGGRDVPAYNIYLRASSDRAPMLVGQFARPEIPKAEYERLQREAASEAQAWMRTYYGSTPDMDPAQSAFASAPRRNDPDTQQNIMEGWFLSKKLFETTWDRTKNFLNTVNPLDDKAVGR